MSWFRRILPTRPPSREPLPVHPFLFALLPAAALFAENVEQYDPRHVFSSEVLGPAACCLAAAALLFLGLRRWSRDADEAAAQTTALLVLAFSYGLLADALTPLRIDLGPVTVGPHKAGLALWGAASTVAVVVLHRISGRLRAVTPFLNVALLVALAPPLLSIGWAVARYRAPAAAPADAGRAAPSDAALPDIYYITLDGYARSDVLRETYGRDNGPFLRALRDLGFYVAEKSTANYPQTRTSLASALNFSYLDGLSAADGDDAFAQDRLKRHFDRSAAVALLKARGYRIASAETAVGLGPFEQIDAFHEKPLALLSEFQSTLISQTPVSALLLRFSEHGYDHLRRHLLDLFAHMASPPPVESPFFAYFHVFSPHPPFLFGAGGEPRTPAYAYAISDGDHFMRLAGRDDYLRGYRAQSRFVEDRVLDVLRTILARPGKRPIVILHSDHGPASRLVYNSADNSPAALEERMAILAALLLPEEASRRLYPEITPVNFLRLVFREVFGLDLELLPDRCYYPQVDRQLVFDDVTDKVRTAPRRRPTPGSDGGGESATDLTPRARAPTPVPPAE